MPGDEWLQIDASSLDDAVAGLKASMAALQRSRRRDNKSVAEKIAELLQQAAQQGTRAERHFAAQIRPRSSADWARIAITTAGGDQWDGTLGTFYGSMQWKQFREWVGSRWVLGEPGEGPYIVRDVIPKNVDRIGGWYLEARARDMADAFPKGAPAGNGGL